VSDTLEELRQGGGRVDLEEVGHPVPGLEDD
jgi:hypothetical protein